MPSETAIIWQSRDVGIRLARRGTNSPKNSHGECAYPMPDSFMNWFKTSGGGGLPCSFKYDAISSLNSNTASVVGVWGSPPGPAGPTGNDPEGGDDGRLDGLFAPLPTDPIELANAAASSGETFWG